MERYGHVFFLPVFLSLCCFSSSFAFGLAAVSHKLVQNQSSIMTDLSKSLPTSSTDKMWWNATTDPCDWVGVTCSRGFVTALSLSGFGLSTANTSLVSRFFDLRCLLDHLKSLDLSGNSLTTIPGSFFSNCRKLSGLNVIVLPGQDVTLGYPLLKNFSRILFFYSTIFQKL